MASCEKCWRDAMRSGFFEGDGVERYHELLKQRECTPEEQAGGADADICPSCQRRTLHMYAGHCMAGCKVGDKEDE